jgi:hypothetical protein
MGNVRNDGEIFNWEGGKKGRKEKNGRNKERKVMPDNY